MKASKISAVPTVCLVALATLGMLLGVQPARAGEVRFKDAAGDATGLLVAPSTPRPSDPELDILEVAFSAAGNELKATVKLAAIGTPTAATGASRSAFFTHGPATYEFRFQSPSPPADTVSRVGGFLRRSDAPDAPEIICRCSAKIDAKTNTFIWTGEIKSIGNGMKSQDPTIPPFGPGTKIDGFMGGSYRTIGLGSVEADEAPAPDGASLTL